MRRSGDGLRPHRAAPSAVVAQIVGPECQGRPDLRVAGVVEPLAHYAHHGHGHPFDIHRAANDAGVCRKHPLPQPVAEHHFLLAPGLRLFGEKDTPQHRLCSQDPEQARRYRRAQHALRAALQPQVHRIRRHGCHVTEAVIQLLEIAELRRGNPVLVVRRADAGEPRPHFDQLVRFRVGERPQEHRVEHAEDGGVRADTQRHGDHHQCREAGLLQHLAKRKTGVLEQYVHVRPPWRTGSKERGNHSRERAAFRPNWIRPIC